MAHAQLAHQSSQDTIAQFARYVIPNYRRFPVCLVRGEGSWVWDAEGNRYLDFFPGWGCNLLGHCPPRVVDAVRDQVGQLIHVPNTWYMEPQGAFAQALSERSIGSHLDPGQCFFCNSGAEANEAAIKLARAHGHAHGRYKIVTMEGGFHGRTFAALTATAQPKYHAGFEPMVPGFVYVPYNDLEAVARVLDDETAAVLVEPIQGEGGVNIPGPEYLPGLRRLCDERGVLVDSGRGSNRHGANRALVRLSAVRRCCRARHPDLRQGPGRWDCRRGDDRACRTVAEVLKPGMHASTFGGNPIACRAGLATIETIEEDGLLERGLAIGERFRSQFEALRRELPELNPRGPGPRRDDRAGPDVRRLGRRFRMHEAAAADQRHARPRRAAVAGLDDQR